MVADIVRRQRVYFRNPCHICGKGRANRPSRTNQIPICNGFPNQLLCDDIQYCIAIADDGIQLCFQSVLHNGRQWVAIDGNCLIHTNLAQLLICSFDFRRKGIIGNGLDFFNHIRNLICIGDNDFLCLFTAQIEGKFIQHLFCGTQKKR